jgi:hypothetical protein
MTAAKRYLDLIVQWDRIAEQGGFADNWGDDLAIAPNIYLGDCIAKGILPTFKGFMQYLATIAPDGAESVADNENHC